MAFDTFDTDSASTAGNVFTGGNLTVQGGAGFTLANSGIAQALEGKKSGKYHIEITCVAVSGNVDGVGVLASWGIAGFVGNTSTSGPSNDCGWGYFTNGNVVNKNAAVPAVNHPTWTTGAIIGVDIDLDNGRIWFNTSAGVYAGTAGTPNPATNTNGFDISHLKSNNCRVYPCVNLSGSAAKFTANFGASAFTYSVPSGFTSGWQNTTLGTYFGTFAASGRAGGTSVNTPPQNNKAVSKYTATFTGIVGSIIIPFAGSTVTDMKGVIYDDTGVGGLPGALLGISTNTITSGAYGENTFTFSGVNVVSGSNYWFGVVSDAATTVAINVTLCPVLTNGIKFNSGTYASPTNPFGAAPSSANFRYPVLIFPGAPNVQRHRISYM